MESRLRDRAISDTTKSLLSRQLATITDTLARASQRRDAAIHDKTSMRTTTAPTPALAATSTLETSRGSDSRLGDSNAELGQLRKRVEVAAADLPEYMRTSMRMGMNLDTKDMSLRGGEGYDGDDLRIRLTGGEGKVPSRLPLINTENSDDDDDEDDPRKMLAALEQGTQLLSPRTAHDKDHDDLGRKIAELEQAPPRVRSTLQDVHGGDLEAFRNRITAINLPLGNQEMHDPILSDTQMPRPGEGLFVYEEPPNAPSLDIKTNSYVIALLLENKGCEWEKAQGMTACLFSTGFNEDESKKQERLFVMQETEEPGIIVHNIMKQEHNCLKDEEKTRLLCRLHVSNIAAGASKEDLMSLFSRNRREIRKIELSQERFPIKRTQSAYIDFWKREAAVEASYKLANIFGLRVETRLAVEKVDVDVDVA